MKKFLLLSFFILSNQTSISSEEIKYTLNDRDRMVRVEEGVKNLQKQIEEGNKNLQRQMDWGFGILFTFMLGLVGFVLWDRRTFMKPLETDFHELKEKEERLEKVLKEYAVKDPKLTQILKSAHLL